MGLEWHLPQLGGIHRQFTRTLRTESSMSRSPDNSSPPDSTHSKNQGSPPSLTSRTGLNAANFFLAEIIGVVMPFLGKFLKEHRWSESEIGMAICAAGLGVFLMQTPAGILVDRITARRGLLAASSILVGSCFGLLPLVPATGVYIDGLLFVSGVGQAFFVPLLGALALGLVGHEALNRTMGINQGWNHAGKHCRRPGGHAAGRLAGARFRVLHGVCGVFVRGRLGLFDPSERNRRGREPADVRKRVRVRAGRASGRSCATATC